MEYQPEELPPIKRDEKEQSPMNAGGTTLVSVAVLILFSGAGCVIYGMGAAFSRAGNWSNHLMGIGVALLISGALLNFYIALMGFMDVMADKEVGAWWGVSILMTLIAMGLGLGAFL